MQHGNGFYDYNDERAYKGQFFQGDFHGDGKFYYSFEEWDESQWSENKRHGYTVIKKKDGSEIKQFYKQGALIK